MQEIQTARPSAAPSGPNTTEKPNKGIRIKSSQLPGVSINRILSGENKKENEEDAEIKLSEMATQFTQAELNHVWNEYIKTIPTKKILATTMDSCKPILKDNFFIEVAVENPRQIDEINKEKPLLLYFLSENLKNGKIQLYVRQMEAQENKKLLSPKDRLKKMADNNPCIIEFCHKLNLSIE